MSWLLVFITRFIPYMFKNKKEIKGESIKYPFVLSKVNNL